MMQITIHEKHVLVEGDKDRLKQFLRAWQDAIWPEWKDSARARSGIAGHEEYIDKHSKMKFDTSHERSRRSVAAAFLALVESVQGVKVAC